MLDKFASWFAKFKSSRKAQIGLAILVAVIAIFLCYIFLKSDKQQNEQSSSVSSQLSDSEQYALALESRLKTILSKVKGVGNVDVLVTLGSGYEYVYATEQTIKETSSGQVVTTEIVLVSGEPVIEKKIYPSIQGVLVSASGANDVGVKLNLISAIQTVIDIPNENITIMQAN